MPPERGRCNMTTMEVICLLTLIVQIVALVVDIMTEKK